MKSLECLTTAPSQLVQLIPHHELVSDFDLMKSIAYHAVSKLRQLV